MPLGTPAPLNKRKKPSKIITDLSHISQDEFELEPEASEFDLGTKIRTPKEIMLEELSLMNNRGSKMFRMRQKRVEKFIHENNPDVFTSDSMDNFQKFVPSLGGQIGGQFINLGGHYVSKETKHMYLGATPVGGGAPVPPPKPGSKGAGAGGAGGADGAGGAGGLGLAGDERDSKGDGTGARKDGKGKTLVVVKTYVSPWEKAMKGDENLLATLKAEMPGPVDRKALPKYKSFNRMATPYGGFEKANQFMKFQLPETEVTKEEPEPAVVYQHDIGCRPSFNRTPIGWVTSNEPSSIHMETDAVPFDGETDEL
ncbi:PREDICTED: myozenin-1-like [Cyprinodon variegatus]|uniref:Myozenin 1 n=1 Tax=Cyprinodon variegatus TaxID=28743 RepID=A0A3Q2CTI2_CYPVA|nr:PREDICTED: myozenin-1-like [Cyprinodon variegatus]